MIGRAAAGVSLAIVVASGGTTLAAGPDNTKAIYSCGTALGMIKRVEGRLNTWSLSTIGFIPDSRVARPLRIRYKSITRIEYGRTPPRRVETSETSPVTLPCIARWRDPYLTIFYKEVPPLVEDEKNKDRSAPKDQREKDRQAREERRSRLDQKDVKDPQEQRKDEKLRKAQEDLLKEKEHFAVFELGDRVLRSILRILETRSGRRIDYEDAAARRAAR